MFIISKASTLPWERVSQSTTADFFYVPTDCRDLKDRLIQVNSTSAGKPHFHTLSRGQVFHKNTLGLAVPISQGCVPVHSLRGTNGLREAAPCSANSQVHPSSHCQGIAMWCWENTNKMWKRKIQKIVHAEGSKTENPKAKWEFSQRPWGAAWLPSAAETSLTALFGGEWSS